MFKHEPKNDWIVISPLKESERVGESQIIIAPDNALQKQHGMARIIAKDESGEKCKGLNVGDLIFYDKIGEVQGRVGNQGFTVVKALNVITVVREAQADTIVGVDPNKVVG